MDTVESFGTEFHMKAYGQMGKEIYINKLSHKTKMATIPMYGKNL